MSSNKHLRIGARRRGGLAAAFLAAALGTFAGSAVGQGYPTPPMPTPPMPTPPMPTPPMPSPPMPSPPMPSPPTMPPGTPSAPPASPSTYAMTPLVSNGAISNTVIDLDLINPWGVAASPDSPIWTANNATQTATAYDGAGNKVLRVALPTGTRGPADVTGLVFNFTPSFVVGNGIASAPATFIFDGEGGTLLAWAQTVDAANAIITYDDGAGGAVYKGLAIAQNGDASLLYAADFRNGKVDVFDGQFQKVGVPGAFSNPELPPGYAPFGIHALPLDGQTVILVAYAQQTPDAPEEEMQGAGLGAVSLFDTNGTLLRNLVGPGAQLNAPWGAVVAPADFGSLSNTLLIGNFGDGVINAFDATTGAFVDTVKDAAGRPIANDGLWGLMFGNGTNGQSTTSLYFAAGIGEEAAGVYGRIDVQP